MKTHNTLSFLFLSALFSLHCNAANKSWQNMAFIAQSFQEVALGSEFGRSDNRIRKWVKPLNLYVQHSVGNKALLNELVDAHTAHLSDISGLKIQRVNNINKANVKLFFTRQSKLKNLIIRHSGAAVAKVNTTNTCLYNIELNEAAQVSKAQIYIPVDFAYNEGKLVSCIVEELTQILGLPRDSEKVFPSIFNDKSTDDLLTGLDETLIRILYNSKIKAGMNKRSLASVLKPVIKFLNRSGLISSANQRVRQSSLYAMLGY